MALLSRFRHAQCCFLQSFFSTRVLRSTLIGSSKILFSRLKVPKEVLPPSQGCFSSTARTDPYKTTSISPRKVIEAYNHRPILRKHYDRNLSNSTAHTEEKQIFLDHLSNNENFPGGTVSILTLNRPNAVNAMSKTMLAQMKDALVELENVQEQQSSSQQQRPRCVILASASPKVFSAGADLKERRTMSLEEARSFVTDFRQTMHRVSELPMPVIAAISGTALGGGLELALCADIRIATQSAILGLVETSLAIIPGAGGTQRLPRLVGLSKAKELIFTATKLSGREALDIGLVDYVVEDSSTSIIDEKNSNPSSPEASNSPAPVLEKALEIAWKIAGNGPLATQASKKAINEGMFAGSMQAALDVEEKCYSSILKTQDRLEGLAAFAEKRKPQYKGE